MERTQTNKGREATQEMMEHATSGGDTFDSIFVCDVDGFSRSVTQFEECRKRLENHEFRLMSVK